MGVLHELTHTQSETEPEGQSPLAPRAALPHHTAHFHVCVKALPQMVRVRGKFHCRAVPDLLAACSSRTFLHTVLHPTLSWSSKAFSLQKRSFQNQQPPPLGLFALD